MIETKTSISDTTVAWLLYSMIGYPWIWAIQRLTTAAAAAA